MYYRRLDPTFDFSFCCVSRFFSFLRVALAVGVASPAARLLHLCGTFCAHIMAKPKSGGIVTMLGKDHAQEAVPLLKLPLRRSSERLCEQ